MANGQDLEATKTPKDRWMRKEEVVPLHNGVLCRPEENETKPSTAKFMELIVIILNDIGQKKRDKYHFTVESENSCP